MISQTISIVNRNNFLIAFKAEFECYSIFIDLRRFSILIIISCYRHPHNIFTKEGNLLRPVSHGHSSSSPAPTLYRRSPAYPCLLLSKDTRITYTSTISLSNPCRTSTSATDRIMPNWQADFAAISRSECLPSDRFNTHSIANCFFAASLSPPIA